jgi:hypothetical protein
MSLIKFRHISVKTFIGVLSTTTGMGLRNDFLRKVSIFFDIQNNSINQKKSIKK